MDGGIVRSQLALTLAWALTPWKAQGMTLNKVRVNLGKAASKPGVAFVALTRARHYDGLALDDSFPAMDVFQKQQKQKMFQKRQEFERCANAMFSATIRRSMRDEAIYSMRNVWSQRDANLADALLGFVQARRSEKLADADVPGFAVARARGTLKTFTPERQDAAFAQQKSRPAPNCSIKVGASTA